MVRLREFFKNYRWALLSGFLAASSYIPLPPWALAFCWVPLWLDLQQETSLKRTFWKAWWTTFVLSFIGFHWVAHVVHVFGYLPMPIAFLVLLGFCAIIHLYIPLVFVLAKAIEQRVPMKAPAFFVLLAGSLSLGESLWPAIFPWNLGYALLGSSFSITQFADVIGFLGLSFLVHLSSALFCCLVFYKDRLLAAGAVAALVVVFSGFSYWGAQRGRAWQGGDKTLRVLQVQANIGNLEKVMSEKGVGFQREIVQKYFTLTREALAKNPDVDMVIWPESAYPDFLGAHNTHRYYTSELVRFIQEIKKPLITGSYANDPPDTVNRRDYNGMFFYQPDGTPLIPEYHKTYLLVFGEYVPLGETFPALKKLNPGGPGWGRGSGPTLFEYQGLKIGPQVCYESLYPDFTEALVRKGAYILVNLTNDSWFGPGFEPQQHMIMTLARGIESRRPLIRSTNTGITTAILADGTKLQASPTFVEWTGVFDIPYRETSELTFYMRFGAFLPVLVAALMALVVWGGRRRG